MNDIKRGEIFYIARGGVLCGNEQQADRPAVVVSNDKANENSGAIEVVYLTTQPKVDLPTHTVIRSTGRVSTVLCEQVTTVSTDRVGGYIGQCTEQEMKNIDIALMISLALDGDTKTGKKYQEEFKRQQEEIESLKALNESISRQNEKLSQDNIELMSKLAAPEERETEQKPPQTGSSVESGNRADETVIVKLQTERDTYKGLYENIFERMMSVAAGGMSVGARGAR